MQKCLVIIFILLINSLYAQNDSLDIGLGIQYYPYSNNFSFSRVNHSVGPALLINANGRFTVQLSAFYEFTKYMALDQAGHNSIGRDTVYNAFFILDLKYGVLSSAKSQLFISGGGSLGGMWYSNGDLAEELSFFNMSAGLGWYYKPMERIGFIAAPNFRFNSAKVFPGVNVSTFYRFRSKG